MTPPSDKEGRSPHAHSLALAAAAKACTDTEGGRWLAEALAEIAASHDPAADLAVLSARARRRLGGTVLGTGGPVLDTADGPVRTEAWDAGAAARVALALETCRRATGADAAEAAVRTLYRSGDEAEKVALVRALSAFGLGDALKPIALDAGRTNSVPLFAALALDNPFPAARYTEDEFNQLVLKGIFVEVPVERVAGLAGRANPAMSRMCEDYVDERTAAGRGFPPGLWLALAPHAGERGLDMLLDAAAHGDEEHRRTATTAAASRATADGALRAAIEVRRKAAGEVRARDTYDFLLNQTSDDRVPR